MSKRLKIVVGVVAVVLLSVTVGPFVYIHFIQDKAPARLALSTDTAATTTQPASDAASSTFSALGSWKAPDASVAGYRVKEVLFGQSTEAAGRTSKVTGTMTIDGAGASKVDISVDMASVKSDQSQRDDQYRGRIMQTTKFPTATFSLTSPISLATIPADKTPVSSKATGNLTLHGTTKAVTVDIKSQRNGAKIEVNGSLDIVFADWGVSNPSGGPATTEDHGVLEFLLVFSKA